MQRKLINTLKKFMFSSNNSNETNASNDGSDDELGYSERGHRSKNKSTNNDNNNDNNNKLKLTKEQWLFLKTSRQIETNRKKKQQEQKTTTRNKKDEKQHTHHNKKKKGNSEERASSKATDAKSRSTPPPSQKGNNTTSSLYKTNSSFTRDTRSNTSTASNSDSLIREWVQRLREELLFQLEVLQHQESVSALLSVLNTPNPSSTHHKEEEEESNLITPSTTEDASVDLTEPKKEEEDGEEGDSAKEKRKPLPPAVLYEILDTGLSLLYSDSKEEAALLRYYFVRHRLVPVLVCSLLLFNHPCSTEDKDGNRHTSSSVNDGDPPSEEDEEGSPDKERSQTATGKKAKGVHNNNNNNNNSNNKRKKKSAFYFNAAVIKKIELILLEIISGHPLQQSSALHHAPHHDNNDDDDDDDSLWMYDFDEGSSGHPHSSSTQHRTHALLQDFLKCVMPLIVDSDKEAVHLDPIGSLLQYYSKKRDDEENKKRENHEDNNNNNKKETDDDNGAEEKNFPAHAAIEKESSPESAVSPQGSSSNASQRNTNPHPHDHNSFYFNPSIAYLMSILIGLCHRFDYNILVGRVAIGQQEIEYEKSPIGKQLDQYYKRTQQILLEHFPVERVSQVVQAACLIGYQTEMKNSRYADDPSAHSSRRTSASNSTAVHPRADHNSPLLSPREGGVNSVYSNNNNNAAVSANGYQVTVQTIYLAFLAALFRLHNNNNNHNNKESTLRREVSPDASDPPSSPHLLQPHILSSFSYPLAALWVSTASQMHVMETSIPFSLDWEDGRRGGKTNQKGKVLSSTSSSLQGQHNTNNNNNSNRTSNPHSNQSTDMDDEQLVQNINNSNDNSNKGRRGDNPHHHHHHHNNRAANTTRSSTTLSIPLESLSQWQSELLEFLLELSLDHSFTCARLFLVQQAANNASFRSNSSGSGIPPASSTSPSQASLPPPPNFTNSNNPNNNNINNNNYTSSGGFHYSRYDAVPAHWDTILTGGSSFGWNLASALSSSRLHPSAATFLALCLTRIDTRTMQAETLYRQLLTSLWIVTVANPQNARRLAESAVPECLLLVLTLRQTSVFGPSVTVAVPGKTERVVELAPVRLLNANTTQLTMTHLCTLTSFYFPASLVRVLMRAVDRMKSQPFSQTDMNVIESLLQVLGQSTFHLKDLLFLDGNGGRATWKTEHFPSRNTGYTFSAWIHPLCVWEEGCSLVSYYDPHTRLRISFRLCASQGRGCQLSFHREGSTQQLLVVGTTLSLTGWTHIAYTHTSHGLRVYVNGDITPDMFDAPYPRGGQKKERIEFTFGGPKRSRSFYGYMRVMELFPQELKPSTVMRLYKAGPQSTDRSLPPFFSLSGTSSAPAANVPALETTVASLAQLSGTALSNVKEGISLHGIYTCTSADLPALLRGEGVLQWAIATIVESKTTENFFHIAKLSLCFFAASMRVCRNDEEIEEFLKDGFLEQLKTEILGWPDTFLDLSTILLNAATPRGVGKKLRNHSSTQEILNLLLDRLEVSSELYDHSNHPLSSARSASISNNLPPLSNPHSMNAILRDLSDTLLQPENVQLFLKTPHRLRTVFLLGTRLPPVCMESLVMLIEKLCKRTGELETILELLLADVPSSSVQPSRHSRGSTNNLSSGSTTGFVAVLAASSFPSRSNADLLKAEILCMLFDISRSNTHLCDLILHCFKRQAPLYILLLIHGLHHHSEAVRVYAIRLLALLMHVNASFAVEFAKNQGIELVTLALTLSPHSDDSPDSLDSSVDGEKETMGDTPLVWSAVSPRLPIRLATFDSLIGMSCDFYGPVESASNAGPRSPMRAVSRRSDLSSPLRYKNSSIDPSGPVDLVSPLTLTGEETNIYHDPAEGSVDSRPDGWSQNAPVEGNREGEAHSGSSSPTVDSVSHLPRQRSSDTTDTTKVGPLSAGLLTANLENDTLVTSPTYPPVVLISVYKDVVMGRGTTRATSSVVVPSITQGYYPGMASATTRHDTRREFSFETSHDFAKVDDRLNMLIHTQEKNSYDIRHPSILQIVFEVLGHLVRQVGRQRASSTSLYSSGTSRSVNDVPELSKADDGPLSISTGGPHHNAAAAAESVGGNSTEKVILKVLPFLERIVDVPRNGEAILKHAWVEWLWGVVEPVYLSKKTRTWQLGSPLEDDLREGAHSAAGLVYARRFATTIQSRVKAIFCRLLVLDMKKNPKALAVPQVLHTVTTSDSSRLRVLLALEVVAKYFNKRSQCEMNDREEANNLIGNLEVLFSQIEFYLDPFPTALILEIVSAISTLAVSNNSWVRKRMKRLFIRRDELAFACVVLMRRFAKFSMELLLQLMDANVGEERTCVLMLSRLSTALTEKDKEEVGVLLILISHLIQSDEGQRVQFTELLGKAGEGLAQLIGNMTSDRVSVVSYSSPPRPSPSPSTLFEEFSPTNAPPEDHHSNFENRSPPDYDDDDVFGGERYNAPTTHAFDWIQQNKTSWEQEVCPSLRKTSARVVEKFNERKREKLNERKERDKKEIKREERKKEKREEVVSYFMSMRNEIISRLDPIPQ